MGKKLLLLVFIGLAAIQSVAQHVQKPKVVIGIVIDQMRADYLETFAQHYSKNGFNRLKNNGAWFKSCYINYLPSYTGPGHACIYTGTVPALHGIVGNNWYNKDSAQTVYCVSDKRETAVGGSPSAGYISPKNMKVTTIADELRLATNNVSRTFAISLKDRGAVLPGGHTANASYWMDDEKGHFMTSTFYMEDLPKWVRSFNRSNHARKYLDKGWDTWYAREAYLYGDHDQSEYEGKFADEKRTYFPYSFTEQKNGYIKRTPYGNSILFDFAKQTIINERVGKNDVVDFLALSFSATDYIGHIFGPNSLEVEDTYARFDRDLANFLKFLDKEYGRNQYILFVTADHGAAHNPSYLRDKKIPADYFFSEQELLKLNEHMSTQGFNNLVSKIMNGQVYLNHKELSTIPEGIRPPKKIIIEAIVNYFKRHRMVQTAFDMETIEEVSMPSSLKELFLNSYYSKRSGEIGILFHPAVLEAYSTTGTSHGAWSPYDTQIPLLFYGQGVPTQKVHTKVYMTDIAPTLAHLLGITPPNGSIGQVILK